MPFVSKATGVPLAKAAARIALGASIANLRVEGLLPAEGDGSTMRMEHISVKEAVLPWNRFRRPGGENVDATLGPEMKSTGEVMGIDRNFGVAYAKSQAAAYGSLPLSGVVFVSVANRDKRAMILPISRLSDLGFEIVATEGTREVLSRHGIASRLARKESEGALPGISTIGELIAGGEIDLVINTPVGSGPRKDGWRIRGAAVAKGIPCITTTAALNAAVQGIEALRKGEFGVRSLQDWLEVR
ncbi:carbamoyl-phosphate synthase large chain [mine drainage metagenome]|uniref:carbamoyl-phosphate synthase (glutamine-hydrolyzing) n=1 Tax=mine drainage metagenome TaxID=410659 RepID=A0A1J5PPC0_9ZZZZ